MRKNILVIDGSVESSAQAPKLGIDALLAHARLGA